jgi:hypothetical protein
MVTSVTRLLADRQGVIIPDMGRIFLLATASGQTLEPTSPPVRWVPRGLYPGAKRTGREIDHSPPSSAEVKNKWSKTSTPRTSSWCGA